MERSGTCGSLKRGWERTHARAAGALRRLGRDRRGAAYAFIGLMIIPLVGFLGLSADGGRAYLVKQRLASSVDAAALAGGKAAWDGAWGDHVVKFFKSNFPEGYFGADPSEPNYSKQTNEDGTDTVRVSATATVPTSFMKLLGFEAITVSAESEATRKTVALDVVLAMDMSGSMSSWNNGVKKIDAARSAAKTLVNVLYGSEETNPFLKIGMVPWNGNVNVMLDESTSDPVSGWIPGRTKKVSVAPFTSPLTGTTQDHVWQVNNSPVPLLEKPDADWKGCVYARYLHDGDSSNDADDELGYQNQAMWRAWEPRYHGGNTCSGCTPCLNHGITRLNQSKSLMISALDRLNGPTGNTDIPQGLSWAWRVLLREPPFTEGSADDPKVEQLRAVVLLTDGANCAATGDGYKAAWGGCWSYSTGKMNERTQIIADAMKAQGVLIYAIQFGFNDSTAANLLKSVASGTSAPYYQYAPDPDALKTVFKQIASSLQELRLSK